MKAIDFIKIKSLKQLKVVCVSVGLILLIPPSFTWSYNYISILALSLLIIGLVIEVIIEKKGAVYLYLFVFLLYNAYLNLVGVTGTKIDLSFTSSPFIASFLLLLFSKDTLESIFRHFARILSILLLISLLFYLFNILGVYQPLLKSFDFNDREYNLYFFNSMFADYGYDQIFATTGFYRFQAFFDEPGFLGTISSLIICVYKFNFKKNSFLYIYLISSFLSMSFASYITLFVGLVFVFNVRNILQFCLPLILIGALNFQLIDGYILSRFNFEQGGTVVKDNRTSQTFDAEWEHYITTPEVLIGKGAGEHALLGGGVSSWKVIVYNSGVIGFSLYISILLSILVSLYKGNRYSIVIFLLFLLTIYHRPNVLSAYYLIIYIGGLMLYSIETKTDKTLLHRAISYDNV